MRANNPNAKIKEQYAGLTEGVKWNGQLRLMEKNLDLPLRVKKPQVWAVWNDLLHEDVSFEFIHEAWDIMKACPHHIFLVLTKRPEKMKQALDRIYSLERLGWAKGFWNHIWLGVTAENQDLYDQRVQCLRQIPAAIRFVSHEPALGPLVMRKKAADDKEIIQAALMGRLDDYSRPVERGIDWVIRGGESGPGARPLHPAWVRGLRDQCVASETPFFFKQWGGVNKKAAGRLLRGRSYDEMPRARGEHISNAELITIG
jgi:protein gp37